MLIPTTEITLECKLKVELKIENDKISVPGRDEELSLAHSLGCRALITMGGRICHWEGDIDEKSEASINHKFKAMDMKEYYINELTGGEWTDQDEKDAKLSDHVILWIYATHTDDVEKQTDKAKRAWLLGSKEISLKELDESLQKDQGEFVAECRHNFCKTYAICKITRQDEKKIPPKVYDKGMAVSPLGKVQGNKACAQLQQSLMRAYIINDTIKGTLSMSDVVAPTFASIGTYLQLQDAAVCFSDLTRIVNDRVAQIPIKMIMVFAYAAINIMAEDMQELANGTNPKRMLDFIAATMTAIVSDAKQAEYYSDYCVAGVEIAPEDGETDKQVHAEIPSDEAWCYAKNNGKRFKIILKNTEDNRQILTGEGLQNRFIADDCETSGSAEIAILKMLTRLDEHFRTGSGILEEIKSMQNKQEGWLNEYSQKKETKVREFVKTYMHSPGPAIFMTSNEEITYQTKLVITLAVCLARFKVEGKLAVGSAKAASVGGEAHLSGHCYAVLCGTDQNTDAAKEPTPTTEPINYMPYDERDNKSNTRPKEPTPTTEPIIYMPYDERGNKSNTRLIIVEGTNWISQNTQQIEGKDTEGFDLSMNTVAAGLTEITKCKDANIPSDKGRGLVEMQTSSFYQHVYVFDNQIQFQKNMGEHPHNCCPIVFGRKVEDLIDQTQNQDNKVVGYGLMAREMSKRTPRLNESEEEKGNLALSTIEDICAQAHAETVPPWTREKWDKFMGSMYKCNHHVYDVPKDFDPSQYVSIVFTHQPMDVVEKETLDKIIQRVQDFIQHGTVEATQIHDERLKEAWKKLSPDKSEPNQCLNVDEIDKTLMEGTKGKITLRRRCQCMQQLIFVCSIKREDLKLVKKSVSAWADHIMKAQTELEKARKDLIK